MDNLYLGRIKRIWHLSTMRAGKVQASLRIRAVSPEPPLLAHTSSESRGTFRQKARSLAPLNGWACAVKICHNGMLKDTNSLDAAHFILLVSDDSSRSMCRQRSDQVWGLTEELCIMILSFSDRQVWANRAYPDQTAPLSDQGLHWLQCHLHLLDVLLYTKAILFKF